jgi:hypothetical protein
VSEEAIPTNCCFLFLRQFGVPIGHIFREEPLIKFYCDSITLHFRKHAKFSRLGVSVNLAPFIALFSCNSEYTVGYATTNDATTNECYNEVFSNKIRMLQRTQMLQRTRRILKRCSFAGINYPNL